MINLPEIDYSNYSVQGDDDSFQMQFFDLTQDLYLVQNITEVTRFRSTGKPSILDYVFTYEEDLKYMSPVGLSDYIGLMWD